MRLKNYFITGVLLVMFLAAGCTSQTPESIRELKDVEIRQYEGKKLSSVSDFRENSIKGPQYVDIDSYKLEITGLLNNPMSLTYDEVLDNQKYKKVVTLYCVEGWNAEILWEGVLVRDILKQAEIRPEANTVIFHAYDGYTTSFPLEYIMDNDIMIAYMMNGVVLPPERGFPFQLVAEDKWGYKWIKWITKIEFSDDESYEGFWESRGYSNEGDLDKSFR
ncbi:MAG: molybdopterin-dependent oxidoreductase [Nanoarchaeota archaeon]|nr:molybdopterin-dependent oxidoreductase [Nanoarchaeota archaeon]